MFAVLGIFSIVSLYMLKKRFSALIAASIVVVVLGLKGVSILYVELAGPMFSEQLDAYIGGDLGSLTYYFISFLILLLSLCFVFRTSRAKKLLGDDSLFASGSINMLERLFYFGALTLTLLFYTEVILVGNIPLFHNLERFEYEEMYSGFLYKILMKYSFLLFTSFGFFFVRKRIRDGRFNVPFLMLFLSYFPLFILTGHRFSIFFSSICYFVLPVAAFFFAKQAGVLVPAKNTGILQKVVSSRAALVFIVLSVFGLISFTIYNSLFNVRGYDDPTNAFEQRLLVQPSELWWDTWYRIYVENVRDPEFAEELMFEAPLFPDKNTGIQLLMVNALGFERSTELLEQGSQYAGGYPEVLFEWLSDANAFLFMVFYCLITAWLLRLAVVSSFYGKYFTFIMSIYLYYGLSLLYIGGMLNFAMNPTYWIKIMVFIFIFLLEYKPFTKPSRQVGSLTSLEQR